MRPFSYTAPATLAEALGELSGSTRALAGGTDLLTLMKADLAAPERLVAVGRVLPAGISEEPHGLTIGAATTLAEIEHDIAIAGRFTALAQAAATAASAQLRNVATLGGNLLQRPRCWYFRHRHIDCWLKGGERCPAREGENQRHALFGGQHCVAVHPSDPAAALLALDARVRVCGRHRERVLDVGAFFAPPQPERRQETVIAPDELVVALHLPAPPAGTRSVYLKAMDRQAFAFALAGAAVVMRVAGASPRIEHARLVLSGVAPVPWRAAAAERVLVGAEPGEAVFQRAARVALDEAVPLRHNGWKVPLARALVTRALESVWASLRQ